MKEIAEIPAFGPFQTADLVDDFWVVRDMTPAELAIAYPPSPAPPPLTQEEARIARQSQVNAERDRRLQALADGYSERERETWHVQRAEAEALLSDPYAAAPMLRAIADGRGIPVAEIANRVVALSAAFASASGALLSSATVLIEMDPIPDDITDDKWWP